MAYLTLPGLIDPHVHLRDPGQTEKEDFLTGTQAALAGGFTTVIDMPNNTIPITTEERLIEKQKISKEKIVCDVGFYFGTLGDNLDEFSTLQSRFNRGQPQGLEAKAKGLKVYLNHTTGNFILDKTKLLEILKSWPKNLPILFHAEEATFDEVLKLLWESPRPIHLCHMSTEYELKKVMEAKEQGLPVTCGVTPHHLFLTQDDEKRLGPYGMMKPRLKPQKDVDFLWKHLSAIDMIESDHAPHTKEEKRGHPVPFGVPGLETTLPLLLTAVKQNRLTIDDVVRLCHTGPKNLLSLTTDKTTGIEIDPSHTYEITNSSLFTKCGWTPFDGFKATGKVKKVVLRGEKVFENDVVLATPGSGHLI